MGRERKRGFVSQCDVNGEYEIFIPLPQNVTRFNMHFNCIVVSVNMLHEMLCQTKAVACSMILVLKHVCVRTDNF